MVTPATGSVVLVPFPFSDLSQSKLRPAVVLADTAKGDWILCQVTSNAYADPLAVPLATGDFHEGTLRIVSYARPGKLFTANSDLLITEVGRLKQESFLKVVNAVIDLLEASTR
ncbi:MAG: type II toxin-antitoxin system PemK/MazF family toxin [Gammaproteobacteria bacterium]|nr:type II toxin-antitoxin system PemK/MazF family toxin [Gammaproteobacteria bacterium]